MRRARGRQQQETRGARAQATPVGIVLILAIVISTMAVVAVLGGAVLNDTGNALSTSRAQKVMTQFDSQAALVALGGADTRQVELTRDQRGRYELRPDAGWVNVSVTNVSSGEVTTVMNRSMGAVAYENPRLSIVYQGGGVWRDTGEGSVMVSPPEFHYRNATLTLPLVVVARGSDVGGTTTIRDIGGEQLFPNTTANTLFANPLEQGRVNVTVHSDHYRAWGRFFQRRTDGQVYYDHARKTATVRLTVPLGPRPIENAVASTSAGGTIVLTGTDPRTNSYTSDDGDGYSGDNHGNGTVRTAGDISIGGNSEINGTVVSGGSIDFDGGGDAAHEVKGDARYTTDISPDSPSKLDAHVEGEVSQIDGLDTDPPIDALVEERVDEMESNGTDLGPVETSTSIDEGDYYAEHIALNGETLNIDATDGNVTIGVEEYVRLNNSASIEVSGTHKVRIYIEGKRKVRADFSYNPQGRDKVEEFHFLVDDSRVVTPDTSGNAVEENGTQVWVYGQEDFYAGVEDSKTVGVIYAPSGVDGESTFLAGGQTDHYGGIVTGYVYIENKGAIHYDRALQNERTVPKRQDIIRLTYLHISTNRIAVTG